MFSHPYISLLHLLVNGFSVIIEIYILDSDVVLPVGLKGDILETNNNVYDSIHLVPLLLTSTTILSRKDNSVLNKITIGVCELG